MKQETRFPRRRGDHLSRAPPVGRHVAQRGLRGVTTQESPPSQPCRPVQLYLMNLLMDTHTPERIKIVFARLAVTASRSTVATDRRQSCESIIDVIASFVPGSVKASPAHPRRPPSHPRVITNCAFRKVFMCDNIGYKMPGASSGTVEGGWGGDGGVDERKRGGRFVLAAPYHLSTRALQVTMSSSSSPPGRRSSSPAFCSSASPRRRTSGGSSSCRCRQQWRRNRSGCTLVASTLG